MNPDAIVPSALLDRLRRAMEYIVARMVDQIGRHVADGDSGPAHGIPILFAVVAIGVTVICVAMIIQQGSETANALEDATRMLR